MGVSVSSRIISETSRRSETGKAAFERSERAASDTLLKFENGGHMTG